MSVAFLSREAYDALPRVNWSTAKHMGKSPLHYHHALLADSPDTGPRKRGRATHLAVYEPDRFRSECVVWTEGTRRGKAWEAFKAEHRGRELLTESEHATAVTLAKAVRSSAMAAPFISGGKGEQTVLWVHTEPTVGGVEGFSLECKARVDFVANVGAIVDLKTTRDASPEGFGREVARYEYHCQAAFYVDGYEAATGVRLPYVIVAVEAAAPHVVQVYRVPEDLLYLGRDRYRALLRRIHDARSNSSWPGYHTEPLDLTLPRWAAPAEDDAAASLDLVFHEGEAHG